jgi:hypothetical protein
MILINILLSCVITNLIKNIDKKGFFYELYIYLIFSVIFIHLVFFIEYLIISFKINIIFVDNYILNT